MTGPVLDLERYIAGFAASPLGPLAGMSPWQMCEDAADIVRGLVGSAHGYRIEGDIAIHPTAIIEPGAVLKGPLMIGPRCRVASHAYLRGGNWLSADCILGPGVELKSSFVFDRTVLAHFNFVGNSLLGAEVNLEAGSVICNHRNERVDRSLRVRVGARSFRLETEKFGALIGDGARIGANAVVAPASLLPPGSVVARLALHDEDAG